MKIAVFHNLPGGGSVRVMSEICDYLSKKHKVDVFSISEKSANTWVDVLLARKQETIIVNPWQGFWRRNLWILIRLKKAHRLLATEIDRKKYDLVIVNHDYFTKAPYLLNYLKTRTIYILHEPQREFYESWKVHAPYFKDKIANFVRYFIKFIDYRNTQKAELIVANSKYSQRVIRKVYKRKSILLYPGVDSDKFFPSSIKKKYQILLVGSLSRVKGHHFVIKALKNILGEYSILIVGNGRKKDREYIRNIVPDKNRFIKIISHVDDSRIINLYRESKLVCIGAYFEPFGMTALESISCGIPVVAVNEGGLREIIKNGRTGYLSKRDEDDFKNKTILALKNIKRVKLKQIENIKQNWSWEKSLKKLDRLLVK